MWAWLIAAVIQRNELRAVPQLLVVFGWWSGYSKVWKEIILLVFLKPTKISGYSEIWSCGSFYLSWWWGNIALSTPPTPMCGTASHANSCPGKSCKNLQLCQAPVLWLWWLCSPCWAELLPQMSVPLVFMCPDGPKGLHFTVSLPSSNYTHEHRYALTEAH